MDSDWQPCLKQYTKCVIEIGGRIYEGVNSCDIGDAEICPRVIAGAKTGEDYDLCGPPKHAEQVAAAKVPDGLKDGIATLLGHWWACRECQYALRIKGVDVIRLKGDPPNDLPV